jgi:sulfatase maturation enzyme AslB (radical SAM superfamily)
MNQIRKTAFGYSTQCNIKCAHCVAAQDSIGHQNHKMDLRRARDLIDEMAGANVTAISFTVGEPLIFLNDILSLVRLCNKYGIYSRVVSNGFWAKTPEQANHIISELKITGLSQLRLSFSRWHQAHVNRENILNAAKSCQKFGLDYFISFVTDFSIDDDTFEQYLHDNRLKYFPEPLLYFGRAEGLNRIQVFTDYPPHLCDMNPILTPELDMYACCDAQNRFEKTNFFFIGNVKNHTINELFEKYEQDSLFHLIKTVGLSKIATFTGLKASEIVKYRKCELCEKLFNSPENLKFLRNKVDANQGWER